MFYYMKTLQGSVSMKRMCIGSLPVQNHSDSRTLCLSIPQSNIDVFCHIIAIKVNKCTKIWDKSELFIQNLWFVSNNFHFQ